MAIIHSPQIEEVLQETAENLSWDDYAFIFSQNEDWTDDEASFVMEATPMARRCLFEYKKLGLHRSNPFRFSTHRSDLPQIIIYDQSKPVSKGFADLMGRYPWKSSMAFPSYGFGGASSITILYSRRVEVSGELEQTTFGFLSPKLTQLNAWARKALEEHLIKQPLSAREKECMLLVAEGKTSREIAEILKITKRTVDFHIQNSTLKLHCTSRSQAVSKLAGLSLSNAIDGNHS